MTEAPSPFSAHNPQMRIAYDATTLRPLLQCYRKGYYAHVEGWDNGDMMHRDFGRYYHSALEGFDRAKILGDSHDNCLDYAVKVALMESEGFDAISYKNQKTRRTLVRAVIWYCDTIGSNPDYKPYVFPDGTPGVELSFTFPLGMANRYGEEYVLCGHMDGIVDAGMGLFIRERKTTMKTLSTYFFDQYSPDVQISLYDLAGSVLFGRASGCLDDLGSRT